MTGEWRPMIEAPHDGREVLIWHPKTREMFVCYWRPRHGWMVATQQDGMPIVLDAGPTHWQHLPAPPTA